MKTKEKEISKPSNNSSEQVGLKSEETEESKLINDKYLQKTKAPTFNNFSHKQTEDIAVMSVNPGCTNAYKLMLTWIKFCNTSVRLHRLPEIVESYETLA